MKKAFLFFWALLPFISINSQNIAIRTRLSDIIIEGNVIETTSFLDNAGIIYTSNLIQVDKIFKGKVIGDQIEVLTLGGRVGNRRGNVSHGHTFKKGHRGIFFCRNASKEQFQDTDNKFTITGIEGGFISYLSGAGNPVAADIFSVYHNIVTEIYKPIILQAKEPVKILNSKHENIELFGNPDSDNIAISYMFENVTLSSDFKKVTFDVFAKCSHNGIRFGKSNIYVNYNQIVFGANIATSGGIKLTPGQIIKNSAYSLIKTDQNSSKLKIEIGSNFNSISEAYQLSSIPEQLLHVELDVQNFWALGNIGFDAVQMSNQSWYYDGAYNPFDRVAVEDPIEGGKVENSVGITYEIRNVKTSGVSEKYLEYDILARAHSTGTLIQVINMYFDYNTLAFGPSIVNNGGVQIEHSDSLSNYFQIVSDAIDSEGSANNLRIAYIYSGPGKFFELPTSLFTLCHVKMKILDCERKAGIQFDKKTMELFMPSAYIIDKVFKYTEYNPIIANDKYDQYICSAINPIIRNFNDTIPAGIGRLITINGKNFGNNGSLFFTNVYSKSNNSEIFTKAFPADSVLWSDTLVKYYVMSDLDNDLGLKNSPASSGRIKIETESGKFTISDDSLYVPYAIINDRDGPDSPADRLNLVDANGSGGYSFYIDSEFVNLGATPCIIDAICTWNNASKAKWRFMGAESYTTKQKNFKNQIIWSEEPSLFVTGVTYWDDNLDLCDTFTFSQDIDMTIFNPSFWIGSDSIYGNYNCNKPPGKFEIDIQSVILHELGHVHAISHVSDKNKVMYTTRDWGVEKPILHPDDIIASIDVVNNSLNVWPSDCDVPILTLGITCANNTTLISDQNLLKIFPNPVSGTDLWIKGDFDIGTLQVKISNMVGSTVLNLDTFTSDNGIALIKINESLPNGMYQMNVLFKQKHLVGKFIKLF